MLNEKGDRNDQFSLITVVLKNCLASCIIIKLLFRVSVKKIKHAQWTSYKTITHFKFKLWCLFT